MRVLLAALAVAALVSPAAAGNQCNPYFYEAEVAGVSYTGVGVAC